MAHVLLVEDEAPFREDIAHYLRLKSYDVTEAAGGEEAINRLQHEHFDVVLCDIMMPGTDGYHVLKYQRAFEGVNRAAAATPFIFLTALADTGDQILGRELGCDDFLSKPVDFDLLSTTLSTRLAAQRERLRAHEYQQRTLCSAVQAVYGEELLIPAQHMMQLVSYLEHISEEDSAAALQKLLPHVKEIAGKQLHTTHLLKDAEHLAHHLSVHARPLILGEEFKRSAELTLNRNDMGSKLQIKLSHTVTISSDDALITRLMHVLVTHWPQDSLTLTINRQGTDAALIFSTNDPSACTLGHSLTQLLTMKECQPLEMLSALYYADQFARAHHGQALITLSGRTPQQVSLLLPTAVLQ